MSKDSPYIALCKILEEESKNSMKSEIAIARKKVQEYINGDKDKYLQLKAEAEYEPNGGEALSYVISFLGFAVAALAFAFTIFSTYNTYIMAMTVSIALIIEFVLAIRTLNKLKKSNRWKKYILAVINEFNPENIIE